LKTQLSQKLLLNQLWKLLSLQQLNLILDCQLLRNQLLDNVVYRIHFVYLKFVQFRFLLVEYGFLRFDVLHNQYSEFLLDWILRNYLFLKLPCEPPKNKIKGLFGVGLSKLSSKIYYLPEQIGDSIFSVIAHEAGFIGATLIIFLFLMLVQRCLWIGKKARDVFGKLLSSGFGLLVGIQAFIHIACNSGIIPYTGLPLPFISYGGTAMVSFLTISGIITNISKYIKS